MKVICKNLNCKKRNEDGACGVSDVIEMDFDGGCMMLEPIHVCGACKGYNKIECPYDGFVGKNDPACGKFEGEK